MVNEIQSKSKHSKSVRNYELLRMGEHTSDSSPLLPTLSRSYLCPQESYIPGTNLSENATILVGFAQHRQYHAAYLRADR